MSLSLLRIPVPDATEVWLRLSRLPRERDFRSDQWPHHPLASTNDGWWEIDVTALGLTDGDYEYEFVVERGGQAAHSVPDPYAEVITRFSGYRGVLQIREARRARPEFVWEPELPPAGLPNNNQIVIYELPLRWVDAGEDGLNRQVGLGTFDKAIFELLDQRMVPLGINCIELLPVQDSPDTLNWGYGTRFFFAPDFDMGEPFDLRLFVRECHRRGIRVFMDLVMNHARKCPLRDLAFDWFFLRSGNEEPDPSGNPRPAWGGDIFRYRSIGAARQFHFAVAEYFIREYHVDGFRLDEFKGIDNYEFIQDFTERAHAVHDESFPQRPFLVIAEDSWRRTAITSAGGYRGRRVVDAMWDFGFHDDVRRIVSNTLRTELGQPSRSDRVRKLLATGDFGDMADHVVYCTSHDVEADHQQRLFSYFLQQLGGDPIEEPALIGLAFEQVFAAFALTLTAAGVPMFLAGEEFADLHDTDRRNWRLKMSDPVDWSRSEVPGRRELLARVRDVVRLRTAHPALQRNEVRFFGFNAARNAGFHPAFDENDGRRLFAYCRTAGQPLGSSGQVIVIGNCRQDDYSEVWVDWPWGFRLTLAERGGTGQPMPFVAGDRARLPVRPFQIRVFEI
jgi:1,4-alpha-glucan branching enzyme